MMSDVTAKDVLASISKLRGASIDEIAADLGAPFEVVSTKLDELAASGFVRPIGLGLPVVPAGQRRLTAEDLSATDFEVTPRGFLELRS